MSRTKTMTVYVVIPTNDCKKKVSRITVRTSLEPLYGSMVGTNRDCGVIDADLSLEAARVIAKWAAQFDSEPACTPIGSEKEEAKNTVKG